MSAASSIRMSPTLRVVSYLAFGVLWLSGCAWMLLNYFFPSATEFGLAPNPWQATILHAHGWIAVPTVFLFGWLAASHIAARWREARNRISGYTLAVFAAILLLSGYALYYTTESPHRLATLIHQALGVVVIAFALGHWWKLPRD
jgi:hypothetical protein